MRPFRLAFLGALGGCAIAACSSFGSNQAPSQPADAGIDAEDGGTTNPPALPVDGAAADGTVLDGAPDAKLASLCVGAEHWVCDDFDENAVLSAQWSQDLAADGSLAIVASSPVSPPNVLRANSPTASRAYFTHDTIAMRKGLRCSFSMKIEKALVGSAFAAEMTLTSGVGHYKVVISAQPNGGSANLNQSGQRTNGGAFTTMNFPFAINDGNWHQLTIAIGFGSSSTMTFTLDGVVKVSSTTNDLASLPGSDRQSLSLGASTIPGNGSWTIVYDDVVCDSL